MANVKINGEYAEFLARKRIVDVPTGFDAGPVTKKAFEFQRDIIKWSCRRGRAAHFEDCGLGKTVQQLEVARLALEDTGRNQLILAPLGVARQTEREGAKFGIDVSFASDQSGVSPGVTVTNYEKLHKFDLSKFGGLHLDESSILKAFDGATRNMIIERSASVPIRTAWTATPAPNDYVELGNHAEFLGVMTRAEMLATFFVHDGGDTSKWRLKGHAADEFWRWVCSWAVSIRKPSDLGYSDGGFTLPDLRLHEHVVRSSQKMDGYLFALPASSLQERRVARRSSLSERVSRAAELVDGDQWIFWCNLNSESEALAEALGAVEIRGNTPEEERERVLMRFMDGTIKRVVTKGSIWGYGMNLQCCHKTALVGLSDSYEEFYQVLRRLWRFGQASPVDAHVIISENEGAVLSNIRRKDADARHMTDQMVRHMAQFSRMEIKSQAREKVEYAPQSKLKLPQFI